jgi:hypothetical protein
MATPKPVDAKNLRRFVAVASSLIRYSPFDVHDNLKIRVSLDCRGLAGIFQCRWCDSTRGADRENED